MSIPKVQLAFQGGGAKLAAMLPVAEAFLLAQSRELINITAVSGTSAGAICAALVACRADISKARDYIKQNGSRHVQNMVPDGVRQLSTETFDDPGLLDLIKHRAMLKAIFLDGKPLLDGSELTKFLKGMFDASVVDVDPQSDRNRVIEKCSSRLTIIASDVAAGKAIEHTTGNIVEAVTDSCSLPIVFRSFNTLPNTHYVDGGLCDNLPVECLLSDTTAAIFAVYPRDSSNGNPEQQSNIVGYLLKLFSASINHNVARSISLVSEPFRFAVDTDIHLLDFDAAIQTIKNDTWNDREVSNHYRRIREFSKSWGVIDSDQARTVDAFDVGQYKEMLDDLTADFADDIEVIATRFEVRVHCDVVDKTCKIENRESDTVTRSLTFKVLRDKVNYVRTNIVVVGESIVPMVWSAQNLSRSKAIPIRATPLGQLAYADGKAAGCIIQFVNAAAHMEMGNEIEVSGVYQTMPGRDMAGLNAARNEEIGFHNPFHEEIRRAEVVVVYPKSIGKLQMLSHPDSSYPEIMQMELDRQFLSGIGKPNAAVGMYVNNMKLKTVLKVTIASLSR